MKWKGPHLLLLLLGLGLGAGAQDYFPSGSIKASEKNFNVEDGLPHHCIESAIADQRGGIWMVLCRKNNVGEDLKLFLFDGVNDQFIDLGIKKATGGSNLHLHGMTQSGILFGYANTKENSAFFTVNPIDKKVTTHHFKESSAFKGRIRNVACESESIIVYTTDDTKLRLYSFEGEDVKLLFETSRSNDGSEGIENLPLAVDKYAIWFMDQSRELRKFDRAKKSLERLNLDEHTWESPDVSYNQIYADAKDQILLRDGHSSNTIYRLRQTKTGSTEMKALQLFEADPEYGKIDVYQDMSGHTLFIKHKAYNKSGFRGLKSALLQDGENLIDYTEILKSSNIANSLSGVNFKKQISFAHNRGVRIYELIPRNFVISNTEVKSIRAIAQLSENEFIVKGQHPTLVQLMPDGSVNSSTIDLNIKCRYRSVMSKGDKEGEVLIHDAPHLYYYNHLSGNSGTIELSKSILNMSSIHDRSCIVLDEKRMAYYYNIQENTLRSINDQPIPKEVGVIHEIKWQGRNAAWIVSSAGLFKMDLSGNRAFVEKKMDNRNFISAILDDMGQIWLGSLNGVFVYNPTNEQFKLINKNDGLPHNTIATMLVDDYGFVWAATFQGLAIISPEGNLIATLYESDGLSNNEFNRYSSFKADNGDLLFGTVNGINVIRPKLWWNNLVEKDDLEAYAAEFSYYNPSSDERITLTSDELNSGPITVPADARDLQIKCGISNSTVSHFSNFFYKLNAEDQEWVAAGSDNIIRLGSLGHGIYDLVIQGRSSFDNRSSSPFSTSIRVQSYFYQKSEFYLLLSMLLLVALVLRQRYIRVQYERQVEIRTSNLEKHRRVIVEQVYRLRQLLESKQAYPLPSPAMAGVGVGRQPSVGDGNTFVNRLHDILESNLDNGSFGLDELCSEIGLSKAQLHRKVKAATGKSPALYIRSVRLHKAMELLLSSDLSISEIAYSVGFNSISYFSRTFAQEFDKTPREVRSSNS